MQQKNTTRKAMPQIYPVKLGRCQQDLFTTAVFQRPYLDFTEVIFSESMVCFFFSQKNSLPSLNRNWGCYTMPKPWKPVQMAAKRSWKINRLPKPGIYPGDLWCNDLGTCGTHVAGVLGSLDSLYPMMIKHLRSLMNTSPVWLEDNINGVLYFSYRLHGLVVELPAFSLSAGKTELEDGMESELGVQTYSGIHGYIQAQPNSFTGVNP